MSYEDNEFIESMDSDERALFGWFINRAKAEAEATILKRREYGSRDLVDVGRTMALMTGRDVLTDAQCAELGCAFYALGKQSRITSAIQRDEWPSSDTWLDLHVYALMVLAIRSGVWSMEP